MKTFFFLLLIWIGVSGTTSAQQNDNCANAIALTIDNACTASVYTNIGATAEEETVAQDPSCGLYQGGDVWFTAVMPSSGVLRIETDNPGASTAHSITIYSGTCGNFTELFCIRQDYEKTFYDPALAGQTLYVRVFSLNGLPGTSFELCAWEPELPVNDSCAGAIELTAGENCLVAEYSNAFTTSEPLSIAQDPSCGAYMGGDVWFKTIVPPSGYLRVETENLISSTSKSVVIYSGSCGSFSEIFCSELDDEETFYDPNWSGQTVYLRVFSYLTEEGGPFELCVWEPSLPANDNCEAVIELTAGESCLVSEYTNALATSQPLSTAQEPSCGAYMGGDVWFKTMVPASGYLRIETKNLNSGTEKSMVIYSGSCGAFTEVFCTELDDEENYFDLNWAGEMVYIRIFSYLTEEGGPFELCVWDPNVPPNDDCEAAIDLMPGETCQFGEYTNALATSQPLSIAQEPSCGAYMGGDVWFKTEIPASGNLNIETKNLISSTSKSIAVYEGSCGSLNEAFCSELQDKASFYDPNWAGQTVYLRIYSYLTEEGGPFELCVSSDPCQEIETSVTQTGLTLTAKNTSGSYQWVDCNQGNDPVAGEIGQSFAADRNGSYAVMITENGCTEISDCYNIDVVGIPEDTKPIINIFPNPVDKLLRVKLDSSQQLVDLEVIAVNGQIIQRDRFEDRSIINLDMSQKLPGMYLLKINTKDGVTITRFIKE